VRGASLDVYDLAALEAELAGTVFAGKLHFSPVTDSTNSDALQAARSAAPHGSVTLPMSSEPAVDAAIMRGTRLRVRDSM